MKIRFVHVRPWLSPLDVKNGADQVAPKGGMTLAYTMDGHIAKVATAVTSKKDVYSKAKGRFFAVDRLNKDKYVLISIPKKHMRRPGGLLRTMFQHAVE